MKKAIIVLVCALLGVCAGYFAAPLASMWIVQSTEPDMFGAFLLSLVDGSVACNCDNQPLNESLKTLTSDLAALQRWRNRDPKSRVLSQEIALTNIRLSRLEQELGHDAQADDDMKLAQEELRVLGWNDVSASHLIALTTQLSSEYIKVDQKTRLPGTSPAASSTRTLARPQTSLAP
jgi:hypothetical protein